MQPSKLERVLKDSSTEYSDEKTCIVVVHQNNNIAFFIICLIMQKIWQGYLSDIVGLLSAVCVTSALTVHTAIKKSVTNTRTASGVHAHKPELQIRTQINKND